MYAIVEIAGQQFKVEKGQEIFVHRLDAKEGDKVEFDDVYLIDNNGKVKVGAPTVQGALVGAKVLEHLKGDKVIVFKKKRRKGYKVKNGHRQYLTKLEISDIKESGAKKAAAKPKAEKKEEVKAEKPAATAKKAETKATAEKKAPAKKTTTAKTTTAKKSTTTAKKSTTAKKAAPAKKAAAKKPAAKKAAPKKDDKKED